ncbi:hypothetical protein HMN09_00464300 [Mycena chlorophos]|uniref:Uncharacterized protein n=1 Tax=Mycena chlorophos TaxID=658473 RepID=A0A8H6TGJ3_MYCCL|nr:hypothetical protein HMN09_00464300 [Mycena chlorophos]
MSSVYSEFLSSGLRGVSSVPQHLRKRVNSNASSSSRSASGTTSASASSTGNTSKNSARYNILRGLARRSSTRSDSSPAPTPKPKPLSMGAPVEHIAPAPSAKAKGNKSRRMSLVELPIRVLTTRRGLAAELDTPGTGSRHIGRSGHGRKHNPGQPEDEEVYLFGDDKIDPFHASPYSSSFFTVEVDVDVDDDDAPTSGPQAPSAPSRHQRRLSLLNFHLGGGELLTLGLPGFARAKTTTTTNASATTKTHTRTRSQPQNVLLKGPGPHNENTKPSPTTNANARQGRQTRRLSLPLPLSPFARANANAYTLPHLARVHIQLARNAKSELFEVQLPVPVPVQLRLEEDADAEEDEQDVYLREGATLLNTLALLEQRQQDAEEDADPIGAIDWRQFHAELLCAYPVEG